MFKTFLSSKTIVLKKFRKHEINILVSTNIVEEGVDIPACNMIIRFSKIHNFGSYIQSKVSETTNRIIKLDILFNR
jgi:ERCC4-related helicase